MAMSFERALEIAKTEYPHPVNHYEEYSNYFVFGHETGLEYTGGTLSPIVIRKSDGKAFNYESVFFDMSEDAEDIGDMLSDGSL